MKKIVLAILGFLAVSCGTNAFASCGDPSKGTFTCDADQISVDFDLENISNSKSYETDSENKIRSITSPSLNLNSMNGKYRYKHVVATFPFASYLVNCYGCRNRSDNTAYTIELFATDKNGNEQIIDSRTARVVQEIRSYGSKAIYTLTAINNGYLPAWGIGAVFLAGNVSDDYNNFRLRVKNINPPTSLYFESNGMLESNLFDFTKDKMSLNVVGYN